MYGNTGRSILIGPGYQDIDLAVTRAFRIAREARLQFRLEAFNVLNHPNFNVPVFLLDNSNAGQLTTAQGNSRQLQFGARIVF